MCSVDFGAACFFHRVSDTINDLQDFVWIT